VKLSVTPDGATNQPNVYPKGRSSSVYRFDPDIFGENDWQKLKGIMCKVGCVSGCKLTTQYSHPSESPSKQSQSRKATYCLSCTHAIKGQFSGPSIFNDNDIGPINVVTEQIKRTKTKGSMKGNSLYDFEYTNSPVTIWILLICIVRLHINVSSLI
jgi:hypothetical protein